MNSSMKIGPSFKGTLTLKTVESLNSGGCEYSKHIETINVDKSCDRAINNALTLLLGGNLASSQVLIQNGSRLYTALTRIEDFIGRPLPACLKGSKVLVALGDVLNPKNVRFQLKTTQCEVGDVHLSWKSDGPYRDLRKFVKGQGVLIPEHTLEQ